MENRRGHLPESGAPPLPRPPELDARAGAAALVAALLHELRSTEAAFVDDLRVMVEQYLVPLRERQLLDAKELQNLFSNAEALLQAHQALFSLLPPVHSHRDGPPDRARLTQRLQTCASAFIALAPFLSIHAVFAANYDEAVLEALSRLDRQPVVARFVAEVASSTLPLQALLIRPIQRLCKYPLFFERLRQSADAAGLGDTDGRLDDLDELSTDIEPTADVTSSLHEVENLMKRLAEGINGTLARTKTQQRLIGLLERMRLLNLVAPHRTLHLELGLRFVELDSTETSAVGVELPACSGKMLLLSDLLLLVRRRAGTLWQPTRSSSKAAARSRSSSTAEASGPSCEPSPLGPRSRLDVRMLFSLVALRAASMREAEQVMLLADQGARPISMDTSSPIAADGSIVSTGRAEQHARSGQELLREMSTQAQAVCRRVGFDPSRCVMVRGTSVTSSADPGRETSIIHPSPPSSPAQHARSDDIENTSKGPDVDVGPLQTFILELTEDGMPPEDLARVLQRASAECEATRISLTRRRGRSGSAANPALDGSQAGPACSTPFADEVLPMPPPDGGIQSALPRQALLRARIAKSPQLANAAPVRADRTVSDPCSIGTPIRVDGEAAGEPLHPSSSRGRMRSLPTSAMKRLPSTSTMRNVASKTSAAIRNTRVWKGGTRLISSASAPQLRRRLTNGKATDAVANCNEERSGMNSSDSMDNSHEVSVNLSEQFRNLDSGEVLSLDDVDPRAIQKLSVAKLPQSSRSVTATTPANAAQILRDDTTDPEEAQLFRDEDLKIRKMLLAKSKSADAARDSELSSGTSQVSEARRSHPTTFDTLQAGPGESPSPRPESSAAFPPPPPRTKSYDSPRSATQREDQHLTPQPHHSTLTSSQGGFFTQGGFFSGAASLGQPSGSTPLPSITRRMPRQSNHGVQETQTASTADSSDRADQVAHRDWPLHTKARGAHPQYPTRYTVPDDKVAWSRQFAEYLPTCFTHASVLANDRLVKAGGWADPADVQAIPAEEWKERLSFEGTIAFESTGRPRNPRGRTGMRDRGLLGKWGPNHAADPIVTRYDPKRPQQLQMVAIQRRDTKEWAIPGGMVDAGEGVSTTVRREFTEEAGNISNLDLKMRFDRLVKALFAQEVVLYRGYVDDPRNTDNAWMETTAFHFHCGAELGAMLPLESGDDAAAITWLDVDDKDQRYANLYASHREWVDLADRILKRSPKTVGPAEAERIDEPLTSEACGSADQTAVCTRSLSTSQLKKLLVIRGQTEPSAHATREDLIALASLDGDNIPWDEFAQLRPPTPPPRIPRTPVTVPSSTNEGDDKAPCVESNDFSNTSVSKDPSLAFPSPPPPKKQSFANGTPVGESDHVNERHDATCSKVLGRARLSPAQLMDSAPRSIDLAARRGDVQEVMAWLEAGGSTDATIDDMLGAVSGVTLLMCASAGGHDALVRALLLRGASVDRQSSRGSTALMAAAFHGHSTVVAQLLDHGASDQLKDAKAYRAIDLAHFARHFEVFELLLQHGHRKQDLVSALEQGTFQSPLLTLEKVLAAQGASKVAPSTPSKSPPVAPTASVSAPKTIPKAPPNASQSAAKSPSKSAVASPTPPKSSQTLQSRALSMARRSRRTPAPAVSVKTEESHKPSSADGSAVSPPCTPEPAKQELAPTPPKSSGRKLQGRALSMARRPRRSPAMLTNTDSTSEIDGDIPEVDVAALTQAGPAPCNAEMVPGVSDAAHIDTPSSPVTSLIDVAPVGIAMAAVPFSMCDSPRSPKPRPSLETLTEESAEEDSSPRDMNMNLPGSWCQSANQGRNGTAHEQTHHTQDAAGDDLNATHSLRPESATKGKQSSHYSAGVPASDHQPSSMVAPAVATIASAVAVVPTSAAVKSASQCTPASPPRTPPAAKTQGPPAISPPPALVAQLSATLAERSQRSPRSRLWDDDGERLPADQEYGSAQNNPIDSWFNNVTTFLGNVLQGGAAAPPPLTAAGGGAPAAAAAARAAAPAAHAPSAMPNGMEPKIRRRSSFSPESGDGLNGAALFLATRESLRKTDSKASLGI